MRRLSLCLLLSVLCLSAAAAEPVVFINEFHYDNAGTDAGEFVEIAGPAGTNLSGYSIELYNGSGGARYDSDALSGVIPDQQNGFGTVVLNYPSNGIQNGAPDGIALVKDGVVLQFLSYEGSFQATSHTANGQTGVDIGVAQSGSTSEPVGSSLRLVGTGNSPASFSWVAATSGASPGAVNAGQTFSSVSGPTDPSAAASASPDSVQAGDSVTFTVVVTPGSNPDSTGLTVTANLTAIGGAASQSFSAAGGNTFSFATTVAAGTTAGSKNLPVTVADAQGRSSVSSLTLTILAPPPVNDHLVISQIYGGGGNANATYRNDYVEIFNPTSTTFNVTGWSLQYSSATNTGTWSGVQPLGGIIAPGEYYLVALASGGDIGSELPAANALSTDMNLSASSGKVALSRSGDALVGCPVGGDLVDLVGYGSANCKEGALTAPGAGNTTAIFRDGAGTQDTNENREDFSTGSPFPRRTAVIAEIGPAVSRTYPSSNATTMPRDGSVTVSFTEPVNVNGSWYTIQCATTGLHSDATIAIVGSSVTITPNVNFQAGEQCSVTVHREGVTDVDTDDSEPNTDTLAADRVWSFSVATGTAPAYSADVHLTMGNPTDAEADLLTPDNYLMSKAEFALSYNRERGTANWVSWHLDDTWVGTLARVDTFRPDPAVPAEWYRVLDTDYMGSGFDRGHMVPNADRDPATSMPINQATFLMTNMIPQAPDNNQGPWANMENYLRTLLPGNEVYIVAGGAGTGGTGSAGYAETIADGHVTVPALTWKAALVIPKASGDDVSRVTAATRTICVIMPNTQGIRTTNPNDWMAYIVSVDAIEALTGYDLFENVPDAIENAIEAGINGSNPPGVTGQSVTTNEDTPASITLDAAGSGDTLTYEIVSGPANGTLTGAGATWTYTPSSNFYGSDSFTFRVSEGARTSGNAVVSISVNSVNDVPVLSPIAAQSVSISGTVAFTAVALDVEDGSSLFYTLGGDVPAGAVIDGNTGAFSWTPGVEYAGTTHSITVVAVDADGASAQQTVVINVLSGDQTLNVVRSSLAAFTSTLAPKSKAAVDLTNIVKLLDQAIAKLASKNNDLQNAAGQIAHAARELEAARANGYLSADLANTYLAQLAGVTHAFAHQAVEAAIAGGTATRLAEAQQLLSEGVASAAAAEYATACDRYWKAIIAATH